MEKAAKKACLTGGPNKGVAILADLFIAMDDPTYIYNQGRCFEQNSRYEDAITKFREYLRKKADGTAEEKADAEKHISDCLGLLGKKIEPALPPSPPPPPPTKPEPTVKADASEQKPLVPKRALVPVPPKPTEKPDESRIDVSATPPSSGEGRALRIGGIATASVGVLALAGGLVANLHHNSLIDELQGLRPRQRRHCQVLPLAIVGYGVGAACLVAGSLLYYLGWRAGTVSVVPVSFRNVTAAVGVGNYAVSNSGETNVWNSILWDATTVAHFRNTSAVAYSARPTAPGGSMNITADPKLDTNGVPAQDSPVVNARLNNQISFDYLDVDGDSNTVELVPLDLAGNPRIQGGTVDMGAYEVK